jgi:hypothetical protein
MVLSFHCPRDFVHGLGDGRGELQDADPFVDASNGAVWMHVERERVMRHKSGGEETGDGGPY